MQNFKVYRASAGSGKTFSLVKEYLKLAFNYPFAFSHILAVTFTNKAANEMKKRILDELCTLSTNFSKSKMGSFLLKETNYTEEEIINKADKIFHGILHNYSNFTISTIDSFVQKLSRTFAQDLKLPSQYEVLIEEKELHDMTIEMLFDKIGNDAFVTEILVNFIIFRLENNDNWQIDAALKKVLEELLKEDSYQALKTAENLDKNTFNETRKYFQSQIYSFENEIVNLTNSFEEIMFKNNLSIEDIPGKRRGIMSFINKLKDLDIKTAISLKTDSYRNGEWFGKKPTPLLESLRSDFQNIVDKIFEQIDKNYSQYAFFKILNTEIYANSLYGVFFDLMNQIIEDENLVHLSEFNKRISHSLQDSSVPYIYERLGEKYNNLLIDEFQDTSILQWHNFLPLIENSLANNNLSLVVGDGKQAIYRFRSGEIEQFLRLPSIFKKELNENLDNIESTLIQQYNDNEGHLNKNFRTRKEIVEFNNDFFSDLKSNLSDDLRDIYKDVRQESNVCTSKGFVQLEFVDPKEDDKIFNTKIRSLINQLNEDGYALNDIAVLVRSNKDGSKIVQYLSQEGIQVVSPESLLLETSPKVQLLVHTLSFINNPTNPITITSLIYFSALVRNLHGKGNLNFNEIFQSTKKVINQETTIEEVLKLKPNDLSPIFASSYSLFDFCEYLIRIFELNTESDPFVQFFLDMVFSWQTGHPKGLGNFIEYWNEKGHSKSIVISESTNAVKVMTIHKAKGLEFPIVIYPFANGNLDNGRLTRDRFWCDLSEENIPNIQTVMLPLTKNWMDNTKFLSTYENERNKTYLDNINILYVALTRPEKQLYVLIKKNKPEKCVFEKYLKNKNLFNSDQNMYQFGEYEIFGDFDKANREKKNLKEFEIEEPKNIISNNWTKRINVSPDPTMLWNNNSKLLSAEWGKLVHSIFMEIIHFDDAENIILKYIIEGSIDKENGNILLEQFNNFSKNTLISDAFSNDALIKNEAEILTTSGEILRPDRFAELPNKIILIDYKTGQKSESHILQLTKYKDAIKTMFDKKIDSFLVYLGKDIEIQKID